MCAKHIVVLFDALKTHIYIYKQYVIPCFNIKAEVIFEKPLYPATDVASGGGAARCAYTVPVSTFDGQTGG